MPKANKKAGKNEHRPSTTHTEGHRPSSHWARQSTDYYYGRKSADRKSQSFLDEDQHILRARHGEYGGSFFKGFIPDRVCFIYWRPTLALLIGDLYMRIALNLLSYQVAKFETGDYFGYTGPMPIFLREYYGAILAGFVGVFVSSVFADSKLTVGIVCLASSVFALITVTFGFLSSGFFDDKITKIMLIVMNVFIFSIIVFEPASLALVFERVTVPTAETSLPVLWTICILTIWLRGVATMITIIIVFYTRREKYFGIIINSVALVFVILYIKMVFIFRYRKEKHRSRKIAFLSTILAIILRKARKMKVSRNEPHEHRAIDDILANAFSFAQIFKCLLSFAVYYFALQLLFVVWSNQFKAMDVFNSIEDFGARFLVLTLLNLINVPIINVLFIVLYPKMKSKMKIDDLKLLGFAYLTLFMSLVLTSIAQPSAGPPRLSKRTLKNPISKIRVVNELLYKCWLGSKWLPKVELNPEKTSQNDVNVVGSLAEAVDITCLNEKKSEMKVIKSVFLKHNEISTFILTTMTRASRTILLLRRVDQFELTGIRSFCDHAAKASLTVYNTIQDSKARKVTFIGGKVDFAVTIPKKMNMRSHIYIPLGTFVPEGFKEKSITSSFGEIFVMLYHKKANKETFFMDQIPDIGCKKNTPSTTMPPKVNEIKTTAKPQISPTVQATTAKTTEIPQTTPTVQVNETKTTEKPHKKPIKQFHPWSIIALYLLSLSQSIESVIMLHFVVAQSPYELRCVVISWLVLARVFGSAGYFATDQVWCRNDPVLASFVTAVFLAMNGCVYWYACASYVWPDY